MRGVQLRRRRLPDSRADDAVSRTPYSDFALAMVPRFTNVSYTYINYYNLSMNPLCRF